MKRIVIWGIGKNMRTYLQRRIYFEIIHENFDIVALIDKNPAAWGSSVGDLPIYPPSHVDKIEYDYVVIGAVMEEDVKEELVRMYGISEKMILSYTIFDSMLVDKLALLYQNSDDLDIKKAIRYYQKMNFNIFGYYHGDDNYQIVSRDEGGIPFVDFENKRMYFPASMSFSHRKGHEVIQNILYEQGVGSPHLYVKNDNEIPDGSVIVDAGACEGNFVLRYIDRVKRAYVIESDKEWVKALRRTLQKYEDKVVICDKFLARYDSRNTITLDSLVKEKVDFIKMDIEGYEIDALLGAKQVLKNSDARCAICSYHKKNDEENIKFILSNLGYKTSVSSGCMFFIHDDDITDTMDFRKGIVYGQKEMAMQNVGKHIQYYT